MPLAMLAQSQPLPTSPVKISIPNRWVLRHHHFTNKKTTPCGWFFIGEPGGIRTHDPLIKSQMLYRLSYEPSLLMNGYIKDKKTDVNKKS